MGMTMAAPSLTATRYREGRKDACSETKRGEKIMSRDAGSEKERRCCSAVFRLVTALVEPPRRRLN